MIASAQGDAHPPQRGASCVTDLGVGGTLCPMDDADAFSDFYRREGEAVLVFLTRRALDVEVALELTAETFAIALTSWRKLSGLADEQRRAWLFTVAARYATHMPAAKRRLAAEVSRRLIRQDSSAGCRIGR